MPPTLSNPQLSGGALGLSEHSAKRRNVLSSTPLLESSPLAPKNIEPSMGKKSMKGSLGKTVESRLIATPARLMYLTPSLMSTPSLMTTSPLLTSPSPALRKAKSGLVTTSADLLSATPRLKSATPTLGVTTPCRYTTSVTTPTLHSSSQSLQNRLLMSTTAGGLLTSSSLLTTCTTPRLNTHSPMGVSSLSQKKSTKLTGDVHAVVKSAQTSTEAVTPPVTKLFVNKNMKEKSGKREVTVRKSAADTDSKRKKKVEKSPPSKLEKDVDVLPPHYDLFFKVEKQKPVEMPTFPPPSIPVPVSDTSSNKMALLNAISSSLICSPNFKDTKDGARSSLMALAENVALYDPEFVLKTALYTRRELNIRTPANFLLALASNIHPCRVFLKKYFKASICLPSDWIDVAELYQAFYDKSINYGSLPAALRRVMTAKFPDFDKYQLAKYNKDKSKSKKTKAPTERRSAWKTKKPALAEKETESLSEDEAESSSEDEDGAVDISKLFDKGVSVDEETETEEELAQKTFTLKQLIRKLHITEPVEHVMCLIGKKYPESLEEFYKTRLPGTWEEERSGKRMKLPVPQTWETQVSLKGNKASTWEELIDNKKLPFMAMLRNLRNMIKAGISPKHHNWVIRKLSDQGAVIYSKQFPFRFFSAYEILDQLEADYHKNQEEIVKQAVEATSGHTAVSRPAKKKNMKTPDGSVKWWLKKGKKSGGVSEVPFDMKLLARYRKALDNAVKISTVYNVQPIKGRTVIFCDVSDRMNLPCTAARGLGKPRLLKEVGLLLGLMCKYSCEESTLILYNNNYFTAVDVDKGTILDNMDVLKDLNLDQDKTAEQVDSEFPKAKLTEILRDRIQVDNMIILGTGIEEGSDKGKLLTDFLLKYRRLVYPDMLFVSVALAGKRAKVDGQTSHPNDIHVSGYSDQILRFIAERGSGAQLTHVENIATAYNLDGGVTIAPEKLLAPRNAVRQTKVPRPVDANPVPIWRTVRVFISSTFRDMHGERDILTRFVFPELRARARKHFINILEVDLRWGVTEEDSKNKQAVEICLKEVSKCQFFIGILGERQGWVPLNSDLPDGPEFDWLRDHPQGASLTELEMYSGALRHPKQAKRRAFFYIRDNSFISDVPKSYREDFEAEHSVAKERMEVLKGTVRNCGLTNRRYDCKWQGVVDGKPFTAGLSTFGWSVYCDLWQSINHLYPETEIACGGEEHINKLHQAAMATHTAKFVGRKPLIKQCYNKMADKKSGVLMLSGKAGTGKSALFASLNEEYKTVCEDADSVLEHVVGSAPGSANLTATLRRLCRELQLRFSLPSELPQEYKNLVPKFGELLKECGRQSLGPLVIFLDGVDGMEEGHQPASMEWLPQPLPQNVLFVLTAVEGGRCHRASQKRGVTEVSVGSLDLLDKAKVVRSTLAQHRKSLDESAFNNQMKILLSKREASNPLYLSLACEELRLFSVYEKVSSELKSLPHTVPQLLGEILSRMETDVGEDLVRTSLCLLVTSRTGLGETELHNLLSLHRLMTTTSDSSLEELAQTELPPEKLLPAATFLRLQRALHAFLRPMDSANQTFSLAHAGIEQAIRQRYMKQRTEETESQLHKLFSGYFWHMADPEGDKTWQGGEGKAFSELPYHLMCGSHFNQLEAILCDLTFVEMKCRQGQITQLIEDFSVRESTRKPVVKDQTNFLEKERVKAYQQFVSRQAHILSRHPGLTLQQALNDFPDSRPALDAELILTSRPAGQRSGIIRWDNRPLTTDQCKLTLAQLSNVVLCVAISPGEKILACGDSDCSVKLYDIATGKELRTFYGHSNKLTDLCFVDENRLVSAAKDKLLCVWDVQSGQRVSTLKGHGRPVNSCASNGSLIASAGWDCNIKIWSLKDGKEVCEFKDMKPINCVSFHPEDESVVTGGWDSTLKIWDIFNRKRKAILRGHRTSVRDAAFSPSGRYLASAALDGEVKLWSALNGSQLGDIQGHCLPINKLLFSPSGKELLTASDDQKVKVWSGHLGKLLHNVEEHSSPASVAFSPDGACVAVGFHFGEVRVFDVESGLKNYEVEAHVDPVRCITYTLDGNNIITGSEDTTIQVLDSSDGAKAYQMTGHSKPVLCVTAGKTLLASTSEDFTCCLFRYQSAYRLKALKNKSVSPAAVLTGHVAPVTSCSFNSTQTKLATASRDMSVRIWDMTTIDLDLIDREPIKVLHACHADWITDVKWSNIGDFLVTSSNDFNVKVWDISGDKQKTTLTGHTSTINGVAYKYGCVVTASSDGTAKVWSHKGTEITTLYGHQGRVVACDMFIKVTQEKEVKETELSWGDQVEEVEKTRKEKPVSVKLDEVVVVTCDDNGSIRVWKPLQANELSCLTGHSDRVISLACSKSGTICTGSLDKSVKLWGGQVTSKDVIGQHNGEVTCVMPSWDGLMIATGSRDGCLKLWSRDKTDTGRPGFRLAVSVQVHAKSLNAVCFLTDSKLVTASDDATIRFWQIVCRDKDVCLRRLPLELKTSSPVSSLAYHKGSFLVSGEWSGEVKVYHLDSDQYLTSIGCNKRPESGHVDWVTGLRYHNQIASSLMSVSADGNLGLWDFSSMIKDKRKISPECPSLTRVEPSGEVWPTAVDVFGTSGFVGNSDGVLTKWHSSLQHSAVKKLTTKKIHTGAISAVLVTAKLVFTASHDSTIKVWNHMLGLEQVGQFCCPSPVTSLRSSSQESDERGDNLSIVCGDKLGNVYFLSWTM